MMPSRKGFDLIQIISIFLIIVAVAALVFVGNKVGLFDSILTNRNLTSSEKKHCNYAKKTLTWLDSKRDINGKYRGNILCDAQNKTCQDFTDAGQSGHDAMAMIWSRYKYIQKTNDKKEIAILKKDIDFYYNQLNLMEIQNDFWNCRMLLDINDTNILDKNYLEKVKKLCLTSTYLSTDDILGIYIKETGYGLKIVNQVEYPDWQNPDKLKTMQFITDGSMNRKYEWYVTYPSDFVARYKSSQNKEDLDIANNYFNKLLQGYYINNQDFSESDRCLLAISSLDLYSLNKDQKYLDWAKEIDNLYFTDDGVKLEGINVGCAFLNRELAKYDNNPKYQANQKKLLDLLISRYWDGDKNIKDLTGEGGFFRLSSANILGKNLRENALIVNLLCQ